MSYATWQEMVGRFGAEQMRRLDCDYVEPDPDAEPPVAEDYPGLTVALGDASAEIDGYLAPLYRLPLEGGPWPLLRRLACELARCYLWDEDESGTVARRAKAARKTLDSIRSGETSFLDAAGVAPARTTAARYEGPAPVMTADNFEGL